MAAPTFKGLGSGAQTSATTTHTIVFDGSPVAGDLLVVHFSCYDQSAVLTASGWTEIIDQDIQTGTAGQFKVLWKHASGSEGASVAFTTDVSTKSGYTVARYGNASIGIVGTPATGNSSSPDVGDPTVASFDSFYQVCGVGWINFVSVDLYPSGFSTGQGLGFASIGGNHVGAAHAAKLQATSSEDPGAWTLTGSTYWASVSYAIDYDASPPTGDIEADLGKGSLVLTGYDLEPDSIFVELGKGSLVLTGHDLDYNIGVELGMGHLQLNGGETLFLLYDPTYLDKGGLVLTGYDLDWFIATNADLGKGTLNLSGGDLTTSYDVELGIGHLYLNPRTQFGAYQLLRNQIKKIDISGSLFDLTVYPPDDLVEGDYFGCVLVNPNSSGRSITYSFTAYPTPSNLSAKGDKVVFMYINDEYYVWNQ